MAYLVPGADAAARLVNMIAELRLRLGYGTDATVFTDAMALIALRDALRAVNAHWPVYAVNYFTTVANQQSYTGVLPVGGNQLVNVFWCGARCGCNTLDGGFLPWLDGELLAAFGEVSQQGVYYQPQPSVLAIVRRHRSYIEQWFGSTAATYDRASVYLIPPPRVTGTRVYFVYTANRFDAPENVTDEIPELAQAFWARALEVACRALAGGVNGITRVVGADGVSVTVGNAAAAQAQAAMYADEFAGLLPMTIGFWQDAGC